MWASINDGRKAYCYMTKTRNYFIFDFNEIIMS